MGTFSNSEADAQSSLVAYCMAALLEDRKFQEETAWRAITGRGSYSLSLWKAVPVAERQRLVCTRFRGRESS